MGESIERFIQRRNDTGVAQHVQSTAGALDGFFAAQHIVPARGDEHQIGKTHRFHGAGGGSHVSGVAGVDKNKSGLHERA